MSLPLAPRKCRVANGIFDRRIGSGGSIIKMGWDGEGVRARVCVWRAVTEMGSKGLGIRALTLTLDLNSLTLPSAVASAETTDAGVGAIELQGGCRCKSRALGFVHRLQ